MDISSETVALLRQLEKAISQNDSERIGEMLASLGELDMTLAALQKSKVGAAVSKLKKHADQKVSSSAKTLIKRWKKVAEASGVAGARKPGKPELGNLKGASSAGSLGVQQGKRDGKGAGTQAFGGGRVGHDGGGGGGPTTQGSSRAGAGKATVAVAVAVAVGQVVVQRTGFVEMEVEAIISADGGAPLRLKMRRKLMEALLSGTTAADPLSIAASRVATAVECAMDANDPCAYKKDNYLEKARQLVFNLKKNHQLREDVREGIVPAERLVVMTSSELMAKDKREAMDRAVSERTEARMLDWAEKNQDKINKQCGITSQEGLFECGRCKSNKTTYTQKQTRSADEPMTTFVTCTNCKNRWKFC